MVAKPLRMPLLGQTGKKELMFRNKKKLRKQKMSIQNT